MKNCVYRFLDEYENVIYIGKAKNLKTRMNNHKHLPESCYLEQAYIDYACFDNEYEMDFAERYYIQKLTPKYNTKLSDKPISFRSPDLDTIKFEIYGVTPFIIEKSKRQMAEFFKENVRKNCVYAKTDIDLYELLIMSNFISSRIDDYIENNKIKIKNCKRLKEIVDNTINPIQLEENKLTTKYNLLDIWINSTASKDPFKDFVNFEDNTYKLEIEVKEKYKKESKRYDYIVECR